MHVCVSLCLFGLVCAGACVCLFLLVQVCCVCFVFCVCIFGVCFVYLFGDVVVRAAFM